MELRGFRWDPRGTRSICAHDRASACRAAARARPQKNWQASPRVGLGKWPGTHAFTALAISKSGTPTFIFIHNTPTRKNRKTQIREGQHLAHVHKQQPTTSNHAFPTGCVFGGFVLCCGVGWTRRSGRPLSGGVLVRVVSSLVTPDGSCSGRVSSRDETPSRLLVKDTGVRTGVF